MAHVSFRPKELPWILTADLCLTPSQWHAIGQKSPRSGLARSVAKIVVDFWNSLTRDLAAAGFRVRKPNKRDETWGFTPPDHQAQGIHLRKLRHRQIAASRDFVERMETGGVLALFGDGRSVNPDLIRPQIRFCVTQADHEIFRFGKLFQKVPTTNRVGRQVRCLVYDVGQSCSYLMGVFELTSSAYTLGCRDDYLGWRGKSRKIIKDNGLRRIMDLASIIALPPYNLLYGGKLIAGLAFSDVVAREIRRRYRSDLLGIIASSATGLHCAILNRIGLKPGGLFRRIGETSGYSTLFASATTLNAARRFLPDFVSAPEGEFSVSVRPLHVLRVAMRACGMPHWLRRELLSGKPTVGKRSEMLWKMEHELLRIGCSRGPQADARFGLFQFDGGRLVSEKTP